jgi:hypothetical protein
MIVMVRVRGDSGNDREGREDGEEADDGERGCIQVVRRMEDMSEDKGM